MIKCKVCGKEFSAINKRHLASHGMTKEDYILQFPNAPMQSEESRKKREEAAAKRNASKSAEERSEISKRAAAKRIERGYTSWNDGKAGYSLEWSEEARIRMKERGAWNKGLEMPNDQKQKLSEIMKDKFESGELVHWNTGKEHSFETKEKIRQTCMKYRLTPEQKEKMKSGQIRYRLSDKFVPSMKDKSHKKLTKDKISESVKRKYPYIRSVLEQNGHWTPIDQLPAFTKYKREVWKITNKNAHKIPNYDSSKRGRCSLVHDTYQVDHNLSIFEGFIDGVSPEIIGHECNLSFIPWRENLEKWSKSSISVKELLAKISLNK